MRRFLIALGSLAGLGIGIGSAYADPPVHYPPPSHVHVAPRYVHGGYVSAIPGSVGLRVSGSNFGVNLGVGAPAYVPVPVYASPSVSLYGHHHHHHH